MIGHLGKRDWGGGGGVLSREGCLQPSFISASTTQEIGDGGLKEIEREGGGGGGGNHVKGYTSSLTTFTILTSSNPNKTLMVLERLSSGKRSTL